MIIIFDHANENVLHFKLNIELSIIIFVAISV